MQNIIIQASSQIAHTVDAIQENDNNDQIINGAGIAGCGLIAGILLSSMVSPKTSREVKQIIMDNVDKYNESVSVLGMSEYNNVVDFQIPTYLLNNTYLTNEEFSLLNQMGKLAEEFQVEEKEGKIEVKECNSSGVHYIGLFEKIKGVVKDEKHTKGIINQIKLNTSVLTEEVCPALSNTVDTLEQSGTLILHNKSKGYIQKSSDLLIYIINKATEYSKELEELSAINSESRKEKEKQEEKQEEKKKKLSEISKAFDTEIKNKIQSVAQAQYDCDIDFIKSSKNVRSAVVLDDKSKFKEIEIKMQKEWKKDQMITYFLNVINEDFSYDYQIIRDIIALAYEKNRADEEKYSGVLLGKIGKIKWTEIAKNSAFTTTELNKRYNLMMQVLSDNAEKADVQGQFEHINKWINIFTDSSNYDDQNSYVFNADKLREILKSDTSEQEIARTGGTNNTQSADDDKIVKVGDNDVSNIFSENKGAMQRNDSSNKRDAGHTTVQMHQSTPIVQAETQYSKIGGERKPANQNAEGRGATELGTVATKKTRSSDNSGQ